MRYSIWFEKTKDGTKKNSWDDFKLFPKNRNKITVGTPNLNIIEIEGRDGAFDWYNIVGYQTPFGKVEDSFEFYVIIDETTGSWDKVYGRLMSFFNGDEMRIWLDEVPDEVATARVYISNWSSPNSGFSEVSLKYTITKEVKYG